MANPSVRPNTSPRRPLETQGSNGQSHYGKLIGNLSSETLKLFHAEVQFVKAETEGLLNTVRADLHQLVFFGLIAFLSAPPFIAFLVITLAHFLGDQYALSALIVSISLAAISIPFFFRARRKILKQKSSINQIKEGVSAGVATLENTVKKIVEAGTGEDRHGKL